jgi:hypothetical protein
MRIQWLDHAVPTVIIAHMKPTPAHPKPAGVAVMDVDPPIHVPHIPDEPRHARHHASASDQREALIERDLNDVYLLMDYLSGRPDRCISDLTMPNPADPAKPLNLVDEVCLIRWPLKKEQTAHAAQAATLFKARDRLNQMANPANGATIAYTILVLGGGEAGWRGLLAKWFKFIRPPETNRSRSDLARAAYPNLVRSADSFRVWITLLQLMLLVGLALTSLLSWNVASGKLILQRIDLLDTQAVEIGRTLNTEQLPSGVSAPAVVSDSAPRDNSLNFNLPAYAGVCYHLPPAGGAQTEAGIRLQQTCATAKLVLHRRAIADRDLDEWAAYWSWMKHAAAWLRGASADSYDDTTLTWPGENPEVARGVAMEQWAADLISVLGNFVLPMMYGFLGATAAVVLNIQNKLRESRLAPREKRMSQVQLVLGIIVGACIGLFMSPAAPDAASTAAGAGGAVTGGSSVALSASALSFLAGFGVEAVFRKLQNMLTVMFGAEGADQPTTTNNHTVNNHITQVAPPPARPDA